MHFRFALTNNSFRKKAQEIILNTSFAFYRRREFLVMIRQISLITSLLKEIFFYPSFLFFYFSFSSVLLSVCFHCNQSKRTNKQINERGNLQNHLPEVSLKIEKQRCNNYKALHCLLSIICIRFFIFS